MATLTRTTLPQAIVTPERQWRDDRRLAEVPEVRAETLVSPGSRAVVVAPHPDDEVLGCAGLLMQLGRTGNAILLIAVSDGEKSHADDSVFSAGLLSHVRPAETAQAMARLGIANIDIMRAHLPDGRIGEFGVKLQDLLTAYLQASDTVLSTWRKDGHPDHEAAGEASIAAARTAGCRHIEIPVWAWHWRTPDDPDIPWLRARKLPLDDAMQERKKAALESYRSQLEPDLSLGGAAILPQEVLAHFTRPYEIYFV